MFTEGVTSNTAVQQPSSTQVPKNVQGKESNVGKEDSQVAKNLQATQSTVEKEDAKSTGTHVVIYNNILVGQHAIS